MRHLALADITNEDIRVMLSENETLFVEHKGNLGGEGFVIAKAAASFANTLGGWILIGVTNGEPNAGAQGGWEPVPASEITDRVRQYLAQNVDPMPPFAATVREYGEGRQPVGIVRVYESSDAPHITGNGQVFVRSVAEDRNASSPRYVVGGVDNQTTLRALVQRGQIALDHAHGKFKAGGPQWAAVGVGISTPFNNVADTKIALRAAPLTATRLADWAVSEAGRLALESAAMQLAKTDTPASLRPNQSGLIAEASSGSPVEFLPDLVPRHLFASAVADSAGVVGVSLGLGAGDEATTVTLNGFRDGLIAPLTRAVANILEAGEFYGRSVLELRIGDFAGVIRVDDEDGHKPLPHNIPYGGELSLPLAADDPALDALSQQWRGDVGRAAGYLTLRP